MDNSLEDIWINAKTLHSQILAHKQALEEEIAIEEWIPKEFHDFLSVFDEKVTDWFPKSCPWDHMIDMKPGFEPKWFKAYNLIPEECVVRLNYCFE